MWSRVFQADRLKLTEATYMSSSQNESENENCVYTGLSQVKLNWNVWCKLLNILNRQYT